MVKNIAVVLTYFCVILSHILAAPVDVSAPKSGNEKTTHVTKNDIILLKEKLAALEADIDLLEPEVPTEEIKPEEDQNVPTAVEPVEPAEPVEPIEPVKPVEPIEPIEPIEPEPVEPVEPEEPEQVEPEQTQAEDEDEYLRKLVIQALTAIYREDADRIGNMLDEYYSKLISNEYDPHIAQPAQEDLSETVAHVPQTESGSFLDKPFTDAELDDQEAISSRKQLIADAEEKLLSDIQTFQDQGLTIDELLADLDEQEQDAERLEEGTVMEESDEETEEDTLLFGDIVENEDGNETEVDDETIADELLNDLLSNLESRNSQHGSKIPRNERMM